MTYSHLLIQCTLVFLALIRSSVCDHRYDGTDFAPLRQTSTGITWRTQIEAIRVEAYGTDSVRVRVTNGKGPVSSNVPGAVLDDPEVSSSSTSVRPIVIVNHGNAAEGVPPNGTVTNGMLTASIQLLPTYSAPINTYSITFYRTGNPEDVLVEEYYPEHGRPARAMWSYARGSGSLVKAEFSFKAQPGERFYGLGQHQNAMLAQNGAVIDFDHTNTEVGIPFLLSSLHYGFVWNLPSRGRVELSDAGRTRWVSDATTQVDYVVLAASSSHGVMSRLAEATGHAPHFPDFASGYWQCKLRYATQQELLNVTREFAKRKLPASMFIIDDDPAFSPHLGDWTLNSKDWPDVEAMTDEVVNKLGYALMISVWPTIEPASVNYNAMFDQGLLASTETGGCDVGRQLAAGTAVYDAFNGDARQFLWDNLKAHYYDKNIRSFWLDADEGMGSVGEARPWPKTDETFAAGSVEMVGMMFPWYHQKGIFDGIRALNQSADVMTLSRSGFLGSQRFGGAIWSGDTRSNWDYLNYQVRAGLNMQMSGIVWWTFDAGGFSIVDFGNIDDKDFQYLFVRWLQYALFSPIMRNHGVRSCADKQGFETCPNEPWSFGDEAYVANNASIQARELLRPYIANAMHAASTEGRILQRPLFFDFPEDHAVVTVDDQFMFGDDIVVAPILTNATSRRNVYLPEGSNWVDMWNHTAAPIAGGTTVTVDAPLTIIPAYRRETPRFADKSRILWASLTAVAEHAAASLARLHGRQTP